MQDSKSERENAPKEKFDILGDVFELTDEVKEGLEEDIVKAIELFNQCDRAFRWIMVHPTQYNPDMPNSLEELIEFFKGCGDSLESYIDDMEFEVENNGINKT